MGSEQWATIKSFILFSPTHRPDFPPESCCLRREPLRTCNPMDSKAFRVEEVSHLALHVGRLLFQNNADTAHVEDSVVRFAAIFGYEAHLVVTYESLLVSVVSGEQFRTKVGHRIPSMNVNMAAVSAVDRLIDEVEKRGVDLER